MRLIDADAVIDEYNKSEGTISDLVEILLSAAEAATQPNPPLTLDELRKIRLMEWLYIEVIDDCDKHESAYYQVHHDYSHGEALCCGYPGLGFEFEYSDYGKTWLAYRRKPEEGRI